MQGRRLLIGCTLLLFGCESGPARGLPQPTAQEVRAAQFLEEGHVVEARALFLQAMQVRDRPFLASVGVVRCAIRTGDWDEVAAAFRQAYAFSPGTPEAKDLLGRTHLEVAKATHGGLRQQHASTAAALFSSASRAAPELSGLAYHTGLAELLAGRPSYAALFLETARRQAPSNDDALQALVLALKELDRKDRILSLLEPLEHEGRLTPTLAAELAWARQEPLQPPAPRPR